ncbi:MAG: DUF4404 family protein [Gammaproteobacteria bacterium]|nr:DUF4404 family protein [Gammaproteobacteria bacterium]QOJ32474.1 MAG: DUF4404 family protein [Gammaproteobacteria bacterium]
MDKGRLQALLAELHRELAGTGSLDAESRRLLDQVLQDVRRLAADEPAPADAGDAGQLEQAALRLEAGHPRLAALLGQIADTLAKLGI